MDGNEVNGEISSEELGWDPMKLLSRWEEESLGKSQDAKKEKEQKQRMVYDGTSSVEGVELAKIGRKLRYSPTEKMDVLEVDNFPLLGKLATLRFIEWVVKIRVVLFRSPRAKHRRHFIKWVSRIIERWETKEIQSMLHEYGIESAKRPDMKSLSFVQIDEFYPMIQQHNSFNYYVRKYYTMDLAFHLIKHR